MTRCIWRRYGNGNGNGVHRYDEFNHTNASMQTKYCMYYDAIMVPHDSFVHSFIDNVDDADATILYASVLTVRLLCHAVICLLVLLVLLFDSAMIPSSIVS